MLNFVICWRVEEKGEKEPLTISKSPRAQGQVVVTHCCLVLIFQACCVENRSMKVDWMVFGTLWVGIHG